MDYFWFLFRFEGRINRAKLWLAGLIILGLMMLLGVLIITVGKLFGGPSSIDFHIKDAFAALDPEAYRSLPATGLGPAAAKAIGTLLFLWVYLAAAIKRLHDRNRSAWWMMPFFVFPGLFDQFADRLDDSYVVIFVALVSCVFCIWCFIELFFLKGTNGPNRFGADPLTPIDTRPARRPLAPRDTRPRWDQQSELEFVPHSAGPTP